ncbi:DNA-processing protein DprA [Croceicoccus sp. F390]|uniref:DNA-processing protein DprA n=1 Tax=Croceicoccus esteveae TaxID=3075597 RepID=A0ABU2ZFV3_9SPHN|nr:DNA-processing protein DprA [Croceicoccus sp. F390]MDT0575280.1 DNA-processing protein DprA [Croceicoccus sp. F390]
MTLSQAEAFARIRLLRSPNIGPVTYRQLLTRFGTAAAALDAAPLLTAKGRRKLTVAASEQIHREVERMRGLGAKYLFHDDPLFPALLNEYTGGPPIITYLGDAALLARPSVAIVGARNASAAALRLARDFGHALATQGRLVVSGLARGIDGAAHAGALSGGAGRQGGTCAVIAGGIDVIYPPQHADLQRRIAEEGIVIAEHPPGVEPQARHFPGRNRIIAGLCAGTLVVEAAPRSGSLITARMAAEAGREVMALPGSPLDGRARRCNQLIREGATLIQTPEEVAELLDSFTGSARMIFREQPKVGIEASMPRDDALGAITDLLSAAPVGVDELIRTSGTSASAVHTVLLELELAGRLERHAGAKVSIVN